MAIPSHAPANLDEWVVMPNHLHGIVVIGSASDDVHETGVRPNIPTDLRETRTPANRFSQMSPHANSLGVVIRAYKAAVTGLCRSANRFDFGWQRSYYEHVIRDEKELHAIRQYIVDNPTKWELDFDNPFNATRGNGQFTANSYLREIGIV